MIMKTEKQLDSQDQTYVISPPKGLIKIDLKEIWEYRDLLYIFIWRNVKIRYKQTVVGVGWAVFQPLVTMLIFTIFFGRLAKIPSDNVPYAIFVYTGLLYWLYFSSALNLASNSLIEDESIVKKVYFPRIIIPISTSATPIIDFIFSMFILFILMIFFKFSPDLWGIVLIPVLILITFTAASGLGLFLASLNVKYRDVRYVLGFFIQIMLYVTPIIYPSSIIPDKFKWVFYLNPLSGVITIARDTMLRHQPLDWILLLSSFGISLILVLLGLAHFRKTERFIADVL